MQFSILRLGAVMAVYSLLLAWQRPHGFSGVLFALGCGTTIGLTILLARRQDLPGIVCVAIGSLIGVFLGQLFASGVSKGPSPPFDPFGGALGALAGGWVGSKVADKKRARGSRHSTAAPVEAPAATDEKAPE